MFLTEFATEAKWLVRTGSPISIAQLFYSLLNPVTLAFCGYLGKDQLDAAALALSIFQLSVVNFASAVRWGLMPFFAQTLAGSRKERVGIFLQRGLVVSVILVCFSWTLIINSGNLLILIGQDPQISADTEVYLMILMPGCLGVIVFRALTAYTDTLGHFWPTFVVQVIGLGCNSLLHWLLVINSNFGYVGSAIAVSSTFVLMPLLHAIIIWRLRMHAGTWSGWSARALLGWRKFFGTMLPSIGTQTLWIFGTEVGNFLAGVLGKSELAAESVLFQMNFLAFLLPVGMGSAVVARIGSHLSRQQPHAAKVTFLASLTVMSITGVAVGLLFLLLRYELPKVFSLDAESASLFVQLIPYLSVYTCLQLTGYPCVAAIRACNRHVMAMVINLISYYFVSLPIGVSLCFAAGWGLRGLWIGFVAASSSFMLLLIATVARMNWTSYSSRAHRDAEFETDIEITDKTPLVGQGKQQQQRKYQEQPDEAEVLISDSSSFAWRALKSRLPVIVCIVLVLLLSLILRVALPPQVPQAPSANVTVATVATAATSDAYDA